MNLKYIKFSIQNAFRRKSILLIAVVGTGLGTALMSSLMSLSDGMNRQLNDTMNMVTTEISVASQDAPFGGGFIGGGSPIPARFQEILENIENVKSVTPTVTATLSKQMLDLGSPMGAIFNGVDLEIDAATEGYTTKVVQGRNIENEYELLVGKAMITQARMGGVEIKVGDVITIPLTQQAPTPMDVESLLLMQDVLGEDGVAGESETILGEAQPTELVFTIVGVYETGSRMVDASLVGAIDEIRLVGNIDEDEVSSFTLVASDIDTVERVAEAITTALDAEDYPVQVSISKDLLGDMSEMLDVFDGFIFVIAIVAAVAGGMSIFIIMLMSVMERLQEFGIFKATGWSNPNVVTSVIVESLTVSIMGSLVGLTIGYSVGETINHFLDTDLTVFRPMLIVQVVTFGLTMGVIGGVLPAIKAARVSPIETLHA